MAHFHYEVNYKGTSKDLIREIEENAAKPMQIKHVENKRDFAAAYRVWSVNDIPHPVYIGIRTEEGKMKGSEVIRMQFEGLEEGIMDVKLRLLRLVGGLELI